MVTKSFGVEDPGRRDYYRQYKRRRAHPYMNALWHPNAEKIELPNSGGMINATAWRGLLHTTEGSTAQGAISAYRTHNSAPHFTGTFEGGTFKIYQHIPLDKGARSLRNLAGGVETNRARCIQIEVVGFATSISSMPDQYVAGLGGLMRWIESNTEIKRTAPIFKSYPASYGTNNGVRFSQTTWNSFNGWCGHQHAPENLHGDPGNIPIAKLLAVETGVKPMFDPPLCFVDMRQDSPGVICLASDGAIYNFFGSLYWGGANGKPYWGTRKAAKLLLPGDTGFNDGGGHYKYNIQATTGETYGYPE